MNSNIVKANFKLVEKTVRKSIQKDIFLKKTMDQR